MPRTLDPNRIRAVADAERAAFLAARPNHASLPANAPGFWRGAPLHWMLDWPTPAPLRIASARGVELVDIDGHALTDLCLGDTGAMFGHGPEPVARAVTAALGRGLTTMLPGADAEAVGALLADRFGLPFWQMALTASDANRFALRVARAVTGRDRILVFDGCYHGAADETTVWLDAGQTRPKPSLWGPAFDPSVNTRCVPFNDLAAVEAALADRTVACVITEPALTNCGIVTADTGFLAGVRAACDATGTLLLIDETHTISSGPSGEAAAQGVAADLFVVGKAIAGGVPCAAWGFTRDVAAGLDRVRARLPGGHSGVGTTLAGSALALSAVRACLGEVATPAAYARMIAGAKALEAELNAAIADHDLAWCVVRLGARLELVFAAAPPRDAAAMRATFNPDLEAALHTGLVNRGFLVTPFHNMLLAAPDLPPEAPKRYGAAVRDILARLTQE
jgi:glutamate-1-semialdehyde 2,1-aminomutase